MHLEYARIHAICRVNQAEYGIRVRVVAPQEYVNLYSTRRVPSPSPCTPPPFTGVLCCSDVVLVVSCVVLFGLCVCVCDLFLFLQPRQSP